jgi:sugar lactone lactonase YvrE
MGLRPGGRRAAQSTGVIELRDSEGAPDGAAVDTDGGYWLTQPPAGRVVRYDPRGRIDRVLELPVSQPTCIAFGGSRMDTLYITTAKCRMSPEKLRKEPLAGALFTVYRASRVFRRRGSTADRGWTLRRRPREDRPFVSVKPPAIHP